MPTHLGPFLLQQSNTSQHFLLPLRVQDFKVLGTIYTHATCCLVLFVTP